MLPKSTMFALKLRSSVILSVDSRVMENTCGLVMDNAYDKLIQLHHNVFLGCLGDPQVCDAIREKLAELITPLPTSVVEAADLIKNLINTYMESFPNAESEVFVVGAEKEEEFKIYKISKLSDSSKHGVEEVMEQVAMGGVGGRRVLKRYVEEKVFNPDMTEEEGIMYSFEGIKFAGERDWGTGGEIQVVAINLEEDDVIGISFRRQKWRQNDPGGCMDEYRLVA